MSVAEDTGRQQGDLPGNLHLGRRLRQEGVDGRWQRRVVVGVEGEVIGGADQVGAGAVKDHEVRVPAVGVSPQRPRPRAVAHDVEDEVDSVYLVMGAGKEREGWWREVKLLQRRGASICGEGVGEGGGGEETPSPVSRSGAGLGGDRLRVELPEAVSSVCIPSSPFSCSP